MSRSFACIPCIAALFIGGCVTVADDRGIAASPRDAATFNVQLGLEYMNQGRRDLAMEKLQRALEQDSRSADVHVAVAFAYNHYGETRLAERHYRRAMQLERDNPNIRNTYGVFLCQHGQLRNAERELLSAARNPSYATPEVAWTNAGICAEKEPDLAKAERYYREALRVNPRHHDALWHLAKVNFDKGNALQARGFLQRYMDVSPRSAESSWLGYQIEVTLGDDEAARSHATRLRADFAQSREADLLREAERARGR
jgi:type IV pilus assembly protein PilF